MALTDADLTQAVKDTLHATTLASHWPGIVTAANVYAQSRIYQILQGMGYSKASIDQWDDFDAYNRSLGIYYALTNDKAAVTKGDAVFLTRMNVEKDLLEIEFLLVNGVPVYPPTTNARLRSGSLTNSPVGGRNPLLYPPASTRPHYDF